MSILVQNVWFIHHIILQGVMSWWVGGRVEPVLADIGQRVCPGQVAPPPHPWFSRSCTHTCSACKWFFNYMQLPTEHWMHAFRWCGWVPFHSKHKLFVRKAEQLCGANVSVHLRVNNPKEGLLPSPFSLKNGFLQGNGSVTELKCPHILLCFLWKYRIFGNMRRSLRLRKKKPKSDVVCSLPARFSVSTASVCRASQRSVQAFDFNQPSFSAWDPPLRMSMYPTLPWQQTDLIGRSKGALGISNQVGVWLLFCLAILPFDCWDLAP